jgi:protein-tyrosine phosphatase
VCTANRCRSPIAEAILRQRLAERHVTATVGSAGFLAPGYPATDEAVATAADVGFDLAGHRSRIVTPELVGAADLVIVMERQHVVELAGLAPTSWRRAFPLRDLVRRAEASGGRARDQPFDAWLAGLGAGRTPTTVLAAPLADDIADPVGRPRPDYDRTRQVLDELLTRLAVLIRAT